MVWYQKSGYLGGDDGEYKEIRDLEYLLEDVNENDEDSHKPERVKNVFKSDYRVYESRGSQYYESLEEYPSKYKPYLENMIREYMSIGEWKVKLTISIKFISSWNTDNFVLDALIVKIMKLWEVLI